MSAIAILDYAGAESLFKQMEQHAEEGRREWETNHKEASFPCLESHAQTKLTSWQKKYAASSSGRCLLVSWHGDLNSSGRMIFFYFMNAHGYSRGLTVHVSAQGTETDHGDLGSETIDQLSGAGAPMLRQEGSENLQPNSGQGTPQRESTQTAVGES